MPAVWISKYKEAVNFENKPANLKLDPGAAGEPLKTAIEDAGYDLKGIL